MVSGAVHQGALLFPRRLLSLKPPKLLGETVSHHNTTICSQFFSNTARDFPPPSRLLPHPLQVHPGPTCLTPTPAPTNVLGATTAGVFRVPAASSFLRTPTPQVPFPTKFPPASPFSFFRHFSTTRVSWRKSLEEPPTRQEDVSSAGEGESAQQSHLDKHGFARSEKASKAAHINLSARLSKEGASHGNSGFGEVWRLLRIARPEAKWLCIAFTFLLISSAITMSIPMSVGKILDLVTKDPSQEATLMGLTMTQFFIGFAGLLTVGACANFGRVILLRIIGERVVARLRSQLYRRTYVQEAEFFDANRVGDLISRLSSDAIIVGKGISTNLSDGLRAVVSGSAGLCAMAYISPKLCGILVLMFPPVAMGAFFYGRAIRNISRKIQKSIGTLTKIAEERLGNIKTSQAFAGEIQEVARYNNQIKKIFALGRRESIIAATFFGTTGWAGNMTILALLVSGGGLVRSGAISIGDLTSFMMYTAFAGSSLFGVSGFYSELMRSAGAASRLFELQDRYPSIRQTVGVKVVSAQGPITFKNVDFAYPTRPSVSIFNGLDFEIPSGSNICIVGPSGGGKSTVAQLLLRFYNPTAGQITINGVDISGMNLKSLRRRIGVVSQEPVLFSGSIAENISYGKPKATRQEIIGAARQANCQFISDFPDGLETQVGARGAQLSGGQKQRIAIARALLKDPDILILDEATSALDAESETLVNSAMAALMRGRSTTISIAHRLSTIKRSERIVVLSSEGTVAEVGTYADLSANPDSAFSKLMEWQMTGGEQLMERHHHGASESHITEAEEIEEDLEHDEDEEDFVDVAKEVDAEAEAKVDKEEMK